MKDFSGTVSIVTGGAGFIGSHICEEILSRGGHVICLDDFSAGHENNVSIFRGNDHFELVAKSICDDDQEMTDIFSRADFVFNNAASKKNVCLVDPAKDLVVNAGGTLNLLEYSRKHGVKKFIHASTGSVYGEPVVFPTTEEHPLSPVSYYGVSKLAGERYVDVYNKLYGLNTTIIRYFHVYGPRQESNEFGGVVSIFLNRIQQGLPPIVFGDGEQVRSFTWVKDLVNVNLECVNNQASIGKAYNAASGIRVSINELAHEMLSILGATHSLSVTYGPPLIGDIMNFDVSNELVQKDLNVTFEKDFFGTLKEALGNPREFLNRG